MIDGTYEEGVNDTLKFLSDNNRIELIDIPIDQLLTLLMQLSGRRYKNGN